MVRSLAGLSRVGRDETAYVEAKRILEGGDDYDSSWLWCARTRDACAALAEAAAALGREDEAATLRLGAV